MGHSEDAVYKIPHKNENTLAELAENFRYWLKLKSFIELDIKI